MTTSTPDETPSLLALLEEQAEGFVPHLAELRVRLVIALAALAVATIACWSVVPAVLQHFSQSVGRLIFVTPAEAFFARLKIAAALGAIAATPVALYQAWRFVLPALFPGEKRILRWFVWLGVLLFLAGLAFGYFVVYPLALAFFLSFGTEGLRPAVTISRHLAFFVGTTLSLGRAFQLPLALLTLVRLGVVSAARLREMHRGAIVALFVAAAVFTPADVVSQVLMAVPLVAFYYLACALAPRYEPGPPGVPDPPAWIAPAGLPEAPGPAGSPDLPGSSEPSRDGDGGV